MLNQKNYYRSQFGIIIRHFSCTDYGNIWQAMRDFTDARTIDTPDEIWLLEHFPVYTQGQSGKAEHILNLGNIPIIQTDRGGQITYHGPGQLITYILIDIQRCNLGVRNLVTLLEQSVIHMLANYGIPANNRCDAPGVYINKAKICSLGLRVRRGRCYHGLALNVDMDLSPFEGINPCGFSDLAMTQMKNYVDPIDLNAVKTSLEEYLLRSLEEKMKFRACPESLQQ